MAYIEESKKKKECRTLNETWFIMHTTYSPFAHTIFAQFKSTGMAWLVAWAKLKEKVYLLVGIDIFSIDMFQGIGV